MSLSLYILISAVYIMTMHFAVGIKKEFQLMLMIGFFIAGCGLGFVMHSYELGIVTAVVLSLIFW